VRASAFLPLVLAWAPALASGQDSAVFRSGVSLVHVDAEVVSADGRILTGLTGDDFRVLDERMPQPIVHFSAGEESLDLILLFDISLSMRAVTQRVAAAAKMGFRELKFGDRVAVMVFNTRTREIAPFTEDLEAVARTLQTGVLTLRFGGGTLIQNAVDAAALRFRSETQTERRRAVLIVTDNMGVRTRRESTVVDDFWESDAILSGLIVSNPVFEAARMLSPISLALQAGMKGIAEKTGGDAINAGDPETAFQEAIRRIRNRYSLYYALPEAKPGTARSIRVELAGDALKRFPKAQVRARTGYIVPRR
jgi:hypothetical protein